MTTKEVEQMIGLSKQTLIYYEKEGFIKPLRDENNYRNYSDEDIVLLKYVQLLRSMEVSTDDIKLIIDGKLSIRKVLQTRKEYIEKERIELDNIEKRINDFIKRKKVYVCFDDEQIVFDRETFNDEIIGYLYLNDHYIKYNHHIIDINDIEFINVSMCSYLRSVSFNQNSMPYEYHMDLDIYMINDIFSFEVFNYKRNPDIFKYFNKYKLKIKDILNLNDLYINNNIVEATRYLQYNFKKLSKEYNLDNPRGDFFKEYYLETKKNSKKIFDNLFKKKEK